jgi:hypothetical protein
LSGGDSDDFEGYVDTAALRVNWISSDVLKLVPTLVTSGGYLGGQYMGLAFSVGAGGEDVTYTFASVQDWTRFIALPMALQGTGDSDAVDLNIVIFDEDGRVATKTGLRFPPGGPWTVYDNFLNDFIVQAGFKWHAVNGVQFLCGAFLGGLSGSWCIDVIATRVAAQIGNQSTVDSMESTLDWATSGASPPAINLDATDPRDGANNFRFDLGPAGGSFTLTKTWPGLGTYAAVSPDESMVQLWLRAANVAIPGGISQITVKMKDEVGSQVQALNAIPSAFDTSMAAWTPFTWFYSDFTFVGGASMNFDQIVEISIDFSGHSGTWELHADLLESGDLARIESIDFEETDSFDQFKTFAERGGSEEFRLDFTTDGHAGLSYNELGQPGTWFGVTPSQLGVWQNITKVGNNIRFRAVARDYTIFKGITAVWRTAPV